MNNTVEIFIYHNGNDVEMLVVNHDNKRFMIITDMDIVNMFRSFKKDPYILYTTKEYTSNYLTKIFNMGYDNIH